MPNVTVSVTPEQFNYLRRRKGEVSPSFLLQRAIQEFMERDGELANETISTMKHKIDRLTETRQKMFDFINEVGVFEKWITYEAKQTKR